MKTNSGNNGCRKPSTNKGGLHPIDFNATSNFASIRPSFPGTTSLPGISSAYTVKPDLKFPSSTRTFSASFTMPTMPAMPSFAKFSSASSTSVVRNTGYGAQNYRSNTASIPGTATVKMEFSFSSASNLSSNKLTDRFNQLKKKYNSLADGQSCSTGNGLYDSNFARMAFRLEFPLVNNTTQVLKKIMGIFIPSAHASENYASPPEHIDLLPPDLLPPITSRKTGRQSTFSISEDFFTTFGSELLATASLIEFERTRRMNYRQQHILLSQENGLEQGAISRHYNRRKNNTLRKTQRQAAFDKYQEKLFKILGKLNLGTSLGNAISTYFSIKLNKFLSKIPIKELFEHNPEIKIFINKQTDLSLKFIKKLRLTSIGLGILGAASAVYNISTADDKAQSAREHGISFLGALGGGETCGTIASMACAPVPFTCPFVIPTAYIVGSIGGGYFSIEAFRATQKTPVDNSNAQRNQKAKTEWEQRKMEFEEHYRKLPPDLIDKALENVKVGSFDHKSNTSIVLLYDVRKQFKPNYTRIEIIEENEEQIATPIVSFK